MSNTQKILTLLRHAKAEAGHATQDDHDRGLNERGQQAAVAMGNYMEKQRWSYDKVLCSSAKRTRTTLEYLQLQPEPSIDFQDKLYLASANEITTVISEMSNSLDRILLIGHNPGLHQLCLKLAVKGDEKLIDTMSMKFPTCTLARIVIGQEWSDIKQGNSELITFMTPKALSLQEED